MDNNLKQVEKELLELHEKFKKYFSDEVSAHIKDCIVEHGEYGEAYETLIDFEEREDIEITHDDYEKIKVVGEQMGYKKESWEKLMRLVKS